MCDFLAHQLKNVSLHAVLGMGKCTNSAQSLTFKVKSESKYDVYYHYYYTNNEE
jgi:hypothetical protein